MSLLKNEMSYFTHICTAEMHNRVAAPMQSEANGLSSVSLNFKVRMAYIRCYVLHCKIDMILVQVSLENRKYHIFLKEERENAIFIVQPKQRTNLLFRRNFTYA